MSKDSLFGTSGIRGPVDTLLTKQFCWDIAKAFVRYLENHNLLGPIAVGMDPRTSSPRIKSNLFNGLATADVELFDEGVAPIPSMNWILKSTPIKAALMVTGSHIAPELNGIKFYAHEEEIMRENQDEIQKIYNDLKNQEPVRDLEYFVNVDNRAARLYSDMLFSQIESILPKWKVALDCANGAQSVVMPYLLERLGLEVIEVNCEPHKDFIARDTDTDDKAEIEELKKVVVEQQCDFGIAFDGDGDRSVFVDEKGNFVQGEYTCTLVAKHYNYDPIITTISASQVVDNIGRTIYRTRVGSPYVVHEMKAKNAKFGFEQNGGAIFADNMYTRDGGSLVMKVLNIFAKSDLTFSNMIATLPRFYMSRTKVDFKWEMQSAILDEVKKQFKGMSIDETDGLKIWLDDNTWIIFRSSQNAPEFRVFAESLDETKSKELLEKGIKLVNNIVSIQ